MALIEKTYSGTPTRVIALAAAGILAVWLGAFLDAVWIESIAAWRVGVLIALLFGALGWWRWRLVVDVAIVNLPLWMILPMRMGMRNFSLVEIALLAAAAGGAVRVAQTGRFRWFRTPLTPYLALMALVAVLSSGLFFARWFRVADWVFVRAVLERLACVFSIREWESPYHTLRAALTLLEGFVFFHVIVARMREFRDARHLVQLSLLSAVLVAAFGIGQYFTDWNRVTNFEPWRYRINSTFPDVNSLPSFLVANLFILLPLLTVQRRWRPRGMAWWVLPLLPVSLWMARSRVAIGALVLAAPLYAALAAGRLSLEKPAIWLYRKRRFLAVTYVLALIALGFVAVGLDWLSHTDLEWTRSTGVVAGALRGRLNIWRSALYRLAEGPWYGCGIGTLYSTLLVHWENVGFAGGWNPHIENAHNYFLQMLTETGIVGGGLFLLIVGLVLYQGMRAIVIHRRDERTLEVGIFCGVLAFLITCLTGHPLLIVDMNLWFWFVTALLFVPHGRESAEFAHEQAQRRGFRRFLLAAILLLAAGRLFEVSRPGPTLICGYGFHDVEFMDPARKRYPFHWLTQHAVCRLYQANPDLTFCLRNILGESRPITVAIRVNGRELDQVRLADSQWRLCSYRLPDTIHTAIKLEFLSDHEWTTPQDRRRLSVQLQSLVENNNL